MDWVHQEIQKGAKIPMVEADAVVRSLSIAMHAEQAMVLPLLQLKEFDQYTTTHSMNVSVLAMALGEYLELGGATVRALGVAGLLHDLGKICIPREILVKPGKLTDAERVVIREHPGRGRADAAGKPGADGAGRGGGLRAPRHAGRGRLPDPARRARRPVRQQAGSRLRRLRRATDQPPLPRGLGVRAGAGLYRRTAPASSSTPASPRRSSR